MAQDNALSKSAPNRAPASSVITKALANNRIANNLLAALSGYSIPAAIVATSTSTTVNFGALHVGDLLVHIPATAGNARFGAVVAAGTAPFAAVVGDLYIALRAINLDAPAPVIADLV